jgi:hypothetical protein
MTSLNDAMGEFIRGRRRIAQELGVSERTVSRWAAAGYLDAFYESGEHSLVMMLARREGEHAWQTMGAAAQQAYLRDETGGRRFWPVKVGVEFEINIDGLARARDMLFAEAVHLLRNGTSWHPDRDFEARYIKPEQEMRYESDTWEEHIRDYLLVNTKVTVNQIAKEAIGIDKAKVGTADQRRISAIMMRLGWQRANGGKTDWQGKRWWEPATTQWDQPVHQ